MTEAGKVNDVFQKDQRKDDTPLRGNNGNASSEGQANGNVGNVSRDGNGDNSISAGDVSFSSKGTIVCAPSNDNMNDNQIQCPACSKRNNRYMVKCDTCEDWYHFSCVRVHNWIADEEWICEPCTKKNFMTPEGSRKTTSHHEARTDITTSSIRKVKELERLEREKQLRDQLAAEEHAMEMQLIEDKRKAIEKFQTERRRNTEEFLTSQRLVENSSSKCSGSVRSSVKSHDIHNRTKQWIADLKDNPQSTNAITKNDASNALITATNKVKFFEDAKDMGECGKRCVSNRSDTCGVNEKIGLPIVKSIIEPSVPGITPSQLFARKSVGKMQLPNFDGNPMDWPLFICTYRETTEQCGYTNSENLIRLRNCLKGPALDVVRASLIYSNSVPEVIESLEFEYGRPKQILSQLIARVREVQPLSDDNVRSLIKLSTEVKNLCSTVEATKMKGHLNNPVLCDEIIAKLPPYLRLSWGMQNDSTDPSLRELSDWLVKVARAASLVVPETTQSVRTATTRKTSNAKNETKFVANKFKYVNIHEEEDSPDTTESINFHSPENDDRSCVACNEKGHLIEKCQFFLKMNRKQRLQILDKNQLCRTCLRVHQKFCSVSKRCGVDGCRRFHHELLHNHGEQSQKEVAKLSAETKYDRVHQHHIQSSTLFKIVPVYLYGPIGRVKTFAFLDDGSSISLIEEQTAKMIGADGPISTLCLKWTSNVVRTEENSKLVSFQISSIIDPNVKYSLQQIHTVDALHLPVQSIKSDVGNSQFDNIELIEYENARPTILIGIDYPKLGQTIENREFEKCEKLVAARTRLGWTVYGRGDDSVENRLNIHSCDCRNDVDKETHELVKEFIMGESLGVNANNVVDSRENVRCVEIMEEKTKFVNGHYQTSLLWKYDDFQLPKSYNMAMRRLECFERKLEKDPELNEVVNCKIDDYIAKGYARMLSPDELLPTAKTFYLPLFVVRHPSKPSKYRFVWDAAAKAGDASLNDFLLKGPDLNSSLLDVLLRFREKRVAVSGDLREMYHQIGVIPEDREAQRFLWRGGDKSKKPDEYVLQVMSFGATCSPSLAQYVKNTHATKYQNESPRAVIAITRNHYVDDLLDCFDTVDEAISVANDIRRIHSEGGFEMRNWLSNKDEVVQSLGEVASGDADRSLIKSANPTNKVLGMWWQTRDDELIFKVNKTKIDPEVLNGRNVPTKRQALSIIMSIYDPIGLVASFVVHGKVVLQEIWRSGIEWDEEIKEEQHRKWIIWLRRLLSIEQLRIPRWYTSTFDSQEELMYELHIYVDASEIAYSAVAYMRTTLRCSPDSRVDCTLIAAKTRVAPQKSYSIPRLELLAAVLGVRLMNTITSALTIQFNSRTLWSDSNTVLCWLRSDSRTFKQFVGLRITEILESTEVSEWRHVPSKLNVADEATKWHPTEKLTTTRWFTGPEYLLQPPSTWPILKKTDVALPSEELKASYHHASPAREVVTINLQYFSSYEKSVRAQAYFDRAVYNFKSGKSSRKVGPLTSKEVEMAEVTLWRKAQWDDYKEEVILLSADPKSEVKRSSGLFTMSPCMGNDGLIRMHGRLGKAEHIPIELRYPVILPCMHVVTKKFIEHFHKKYNHQNHEVIINEIRQRTVIPRLRAVYRTIRSRCQWCKIKNSKPVPPKMGELPVERLMTHSRPFTVVGLDLFGPIDVVQGRSTIKCWGMIFTCLSVRAIHLEVVEDLSAKTCILAIIRFTSRRGFPRKFVSDNGTNFHGAKNMLDKEKITQCLEGVADHFYKAEWQFIPPGSPHYGGAWERLIQIVKKNLYASLPERNVSMKILTTCLTEIEAIVNARPLTHVPVDESDPEPLTPNHFLMSSSSGYKPMCMTIPDGRTLLEDWHLTQKFAERFWRRFIHDYLPELSRRTKWHLRVEPVRVGNLVLVVEERNTRGTWPRGRIVEVHPGSDGQVRSAAVQMGTGRILVRPVSKLAVIDVESSCDQATPSTDGIVDQGEECRRNV